jgi:TonB family protein
VQDETTEADDGGLTELDLGSTLGPFRIVRLLGRGGMASVYEAYDSGLNRRVALKVLPPAFLHERTFAQRFEREARLAAGLEHPHIVPIYATGIDEGLPWVSMRLLSGGTLSDLLREGPLPAPRVVEILRGVAQGLDYAHTAGVVHRDIKPSNIVLDDLGRACLVDFGVARLLDRDVATTIEGTVVGTPQYMSPEQALGHDVDRRCDYYSLAVVAYEMLNGAPPFMASSPMAILMKHVNAPLPIAPRDRVPKRVARVLERALAKEPDARWQTASSFVEALDSSVREARRFQWWPGTSRVALTGGVAAVVALAAFLGTRPAVTLPPPTAPTPVVAQPTPASNVPTEAPDLLKRSEPPRPTVSAQVPAPQVPRDPMLERPRTTAAHTLSEQPEQPFEAKNPLADPANPSSPDAGGASISLPPGQSTTARTEEAAPTATSETPGSDVVREALITHRVEPVYPSVAKAADIQGEVLIAADCGIDGRLTNITILRSAHQVLDEAARKAVFQYKCQPGLRNGTAEVVTLRIPVIFTLK